MPIVYDEEIKPVSKSRIIYDEDLPPEKSSFLMDIGKSALSGLSQIPGQIPVAGAGLAELPAMAGQYVGKKIIGDETPYQRPEAIQAMYDVAQPFQQAIDSAVKYDYKPQTMAGRFAETGANFVGSTLASKGKNILDMSPAEVQNLKNALLSSATFQTAKEIAPDNVFVQQAAAFAPALIGKRTPEGESQFLTQSSIPAQKTAEVIGNVASKVGDVAAKPFKGLGDDLAAARVGRSIDLEDIAAQPNVYKNQALAERAKVSDFINESGANKILNKIEQATKRTENVGVTPELNTGLFQQIEQFKNIVKEKGGISLDDLEAINRELRAVYQNALKTGKDYGNVQNARELLKQGLDELTQSDLKSGSLQDINLLNKYRAEYAKGSRYETLQDMLVSSNGDGNKLRKSLQKFISKEDNLNGFTPEEIDLIKTAANRSTPNEIIATIGGMLGVDTNNPRSLANLIKGAMFGASAASGTGLAKELAAAAGGTAALKLDDAIVMGRTKQALDAIANRNTSSRANKILKKQ